MYAASARTPVGRPLRIGLAAVVPGLLPSLLTEHGVRAAVRPLALEPSLGCVPTAPVVVYEGAGVIGEHVSSERIDVSFLFDAGRGNKGVWWGRYGLGLRTFQHEWRDLRGSCKEGGRQRDGKEIGRSRYIY